MTDRSDNNENDNLDFNLYDPDKWTNAEKEAEIDAKIAHAEEFLNNFDINAVNYDDEIFLQEREKNAKIFNPLDDQRIEEIKKAAEARIERDRIKNEARKKLLEKTRNDFQNPVFDQGQRVSEIVKTSPEEIGSHKMVIKETGLIENDVDEVEISLREYGRLLQEVLQIPELVTEIVNFSNINYLISEYIGETETTKDYLGKIMINPTHPYYNLYATTVWHLNITHIIKATLGKRPGTYDVVFECFVYNVKQYNFGY